LLLPRLVRRGVSHLPGLAVMREVLPARGRARANPGHDRDVS
jgi:hypothetical protein